MAIIVCILTVCVRDETLRLPIYEINEAKHTTEETEIVNGLNKYRNENGYNRLLTDQTAQILAEEHSVYMVDVNEVNHSGFSQRDLELKNKGAVRVGEIVAGGYHSIEAVIRAWINSQDHNKIIKGDFTHCGVSVKEKKYTVIFLKIE